MESHYAEVDVIWKMSGLCVYNLKNFARRENYLQTMTKVN